MKINWLVCGTRKKEYYRLVHEMLDKHLQMERSLHSGWKPFIIEGCCPNSADQYAEEWATKNDIPLKHFPSSEGNYLKRNIEMLEHADIVFAFWDGYSYGTAHTIAQATMNEIPVIIYKIRKESAI